MSHICRKLSTLHQLLWKHFKMLSWWINSRQMFPSLTHLQYWFGSTFDRAGVELAGWLAGKSSSPASQTEGEFSPATDVSSRRMWTSGFGFTFCHQRRRVGLKLRFLSFLNRLLFCGVKMTFHRVLSVILVPTCWLFVSLADQATNPAVGSTTVPRPAVTNSSGLNSTQSGGKSPGGVLDGSMIQRALYVLIGVTMIGVLYFLIRAVRWELITFPPNSIHIWMKSVNDTNNT